jgi:hypothetical protein
MFRGVAFISCSPFSILGENKMRRPVTLLVVIGIVAVIALVLGLTGCTSSPSDPTPTPVPLPTMVETPSVNPTEAPTPPQITRNGSGPAVITDEPTPEETTTKPEASPTGTPARPPAVEFAQRWGTKYPDIPEFAILKAANATCRVIETAGNDWNKDPLVVAGIEVAVQASGLSQNDAVEFAQDADQNYCASVANPT